MPTYFFHLYDHGSTLLDPEGREMEREAVPGAALSEARAIIAADAMSGRIDFNQRIEVKDSDGKVVHCIDFADAVEIVHARVGAGSG